MSQALVAARALVSLCEAECGLLAAGRGDELGLLDQEWREALAALPSTLDGEAAALVRRALDLQGEVSERLRRARDGVAAELAQVDRGRAGARAYAPARTPSSIVDRAA
jgi:hypothetical protein